MTQNVFYGLVLLVLVLSDAVVWLRVVRTPAKQRSPQIFSGILIAIAAIFIAGTWIISKG